MEKNLAVSSWIQYSVRMTLDVVEVLVISCFFPRKEDAREVSGHCVCKSRFDAVLDLRVRHPSQVPWLAIEFARGNLLLR